MKRPRHLPSLARRMGGAGAGEPPPEGGLFDRLRELTEGLSRAIEQGGASGKGERTIDIGGQEGRVVFGYTVRVGDGPPRAEAFGHVPTAPTQESAPRAAAPRQPIVDLFETAEGVRVIAEMPGVAAEDLRASVEEGALLLATAGPPRWEKRMPLPIAVDEAGLVITARNGIVEIRLPRAGGA